MLGGSHFYIPLRASAVMTTADVRTESFNAQLGTQAVFNVSVTLGSATSCIFKVQVSNDRSTWFTVPISVNSSGTVVGAEWQAPVYEYAHVFPVSGNYAVAVPVKAKWCAATVRGVGDVTGSLVSVDVQSGIA